MPLTVLLSSPPLVGSSDLRESLLAAGFAVRTHTLGSSPSTDFATITAAVIDVWDNPEAAVAQTRRWRSELGDEFVPIVWVLPEINAILTVHGLDAGADAVLARPFDPEVFLAQIRSAARARSATARVSARAAEARLLGEQLNKAFAQIDRELEAARRVRRAFLPRNLPECDLVRFAVCHRPRGRSGGDFYGVHAASTDRVAFFVGDVLGPGAAGGLLGVLLAQSAMIAFTRGMTSPGELLAGVNRELLGFGLDDLPLVAMLAGVIDVRSGQLTVARAGSPAPVFVPSEGEAEVWAIPGPFLGTAETTYPERTATLKPGGKLLIGTDGIRPDGDPGPTGDGGLLAAAIRHRRLLGQRFVDAVSTNLLAEVRHEEDFTLLSVEFVTAPAGNVSLG